MKADTIVLRPLDGAVAERELSRLLALDAGTPGEPWTAQHWLLSLPGKWLFSRIAVAPDGTIVGFQVASRKGDGVHVHRMAIAVEARRLGLGRRFMRAAAAQAAREGYGRITAKAYPSNDPILQLLLGLGFDIVERGRDLLLAGEPARIAGLEPAAAAQRPPPALALALADPRDDDRSISPDPSSEPHALPDE